MAGCDLYNDIYHKHRAVEAYIILDLLGGYQLVHVGELAINRYSKPKCPVL